MTTAEREAYRARLLDLAQRASGELRQLEKEVSHGLGGESGGGLSNVPTHLGDLGNASFEEEVELTLVENEEHLLDECNAALARLDAGTFGRCEECGGEIPGARLRVFPYVRDCVPCGRRLQGRV